MEHLTTMYKSILVAVDGSECSSDALQSAGRLARDAGARLTICFVVNPLPAYEMPAFAPDFVNTYLKVLREAGAEIVRKAKEQLPKAEGVEARVLEGHAVEEIVGLADALKSDLIVVGSHGRTGLSRMLLGSVAEGVVRLAHAPVLVVRSADNN
ncbi:MAG: universal stress protein [Vulcanimicrobiaceae bacterium]